MSVEKRDYYYLRLSKEDGDVEAGTAEESCSITSQRTCIRTYLAENGFSPDSFEEISDDGYSGTSMDRPGMRRLLRLVESGKVRTVVVRDLSRFARNYLEAGHYLEFVFPVFGVRFISINDRFDSALLGEDTGGLELAIKNLLNQMYSRDLSKKIKSSVDLKKLSGEYVYGTAPYGYQKGERKNTIVVDGTAAEIVRRIFAWASSGMTITQIARKLNEEKVVTPSVYLAAVRGRYKTRPTWTYESVRNILLNRIYTGDTVPFKSYVVRVGSDSVKQVPEAHRQVIPHTHEAIVSRECFEQAQAVVKSNRKSKASSPPNPFTSLLFCGCCGNRLVKGKPQNRNWLCANRRYDPDAGCGQVRVDEKALTGIVLRAINLQGKLLDAKIKRLRQENASVSTDEQALDKACQALRGQIEQLQDAKMQAYEAYVDGKISKEEFLIRKKKAAAQEEELTVKLDLSERKRKELLEKIQAVAAEIESGQRFAAYQEITEPDPKLLKELVRSITAKPDGSVRIEWNFRDEISKTAFAEGLVFEERA